MLKKILINIFVCFLLVLVLDVSFFYLKKHEILGDPLNGKSDISVEKWLQYRIFKNKYLDFDHRDFLQSKNYQIYLSNSTFSPIVVFGCSYAYGEFLRRKETFASYIVKNFSRDVISFANLGWGAHHMLWLTKNDFMYKIIDFEVVSPPKYAIYVYMQDHVARQSSVRTVFYEVMPQISYYIDEGKLKERKYNLIHENLYRFFTYRYIVHFIDSKISISRKYDLLFSVIAESKENFLKHYPDTNFIVLAYIMYDITSEEQELFKKLETNGIRVIKTSELVNVDLSSDEYTAEDNAHPNGKAWEFITKKLWNFLEKES